MKKIIDQLKKETKSLLSDLGVAKKSGNSIGLDIGLKCFRAVRVKEGIPQIPLKDIIIENIDKLKDLSTQMKIVSDDRVSINFSGEGLVIKRVTLPFMPGEEIKGALRLELKEQIPFDINKAEIKFDILGEREEDDGSKKLKLLVVIYRERDVEAKVLKLRDFGLNVQAVFPTEVALLNYTSHSNIISSHEILAIVDIGSIKTKVIIIEDGKVSFSRGIAIGGDTITEAMTGVLMSDKGERIVLTKEEAEKLKFEEGIPSDIRILSMMRPVLERLSNQIKSSLEYYEHKFKTEPVKKVILAGGTSNLKGLKDFLSKEIGVIVVENLPEIACATGLALTGEATLNIIPEKFTSEKKTRLKNLFLKMALILAGFIFLLFYASLSLRENNLKNEIKIYKSHLENIKDIEAFKDKMLVFGHAIGFVSSEDIDAGRIMKELSNLIPQSIMIEGLFIKNQEPNVKLSGIILDGDKLSEFMSNLEHSPMFEKVRLVFSEQSGDDLKGALDFEVVCDVSVR